MARFPRPLNALTLEAYDALPFGHHLWHVYGHTKPTTPPKILPSFAKSTNSILYKDHSDFFDASSQGDCIVFDVVYIDEDGTAKTMCGKLLSSKMFAGDANMIEGESHNDNYWFATYEDAMMAYRYFVALHKEFPRYQYHGPCNYGNITKCLWTREYDHSISEVYS